MNRLAFIVLIVVVAGGVRLTAETPADSLKWLNGLDFGELKKRAMQHDTTLNFTELRYAFTKTRAYDPYGGKLDKYEDKMRSALNRGNFKECLENAHKIIDKNFTDIRAHISAAIACDSTGMPHVAEFHRWIWTNLVQSIVGSGDGRTPQTAHTVISIDEEYRVMEVLGYRVVLQSLIDDSTGTFDLLEAVENDNPSDTISVYFNIDLPWTQMAKRMRSKRF